MKMKPSWGIDVKPIKNNKMNDPENNTKKEKLPLIGKIWVVTSFAIILICAIAALFGLWTVIRLFF